MRNPNAFATIFITDKVGAHVAMAYPGLPPHYVSILDVEEKAKELLSASSVGLGRLFFLDPINIYAQFVSGSSEIYTNLLFPDKSLNEIPPYLQMAVDTNEKTSRNSSLLMTEKATTTVEVIISEVPDYDSSPPPPGIQNRSCCQISAAMVLGYWDDRGYSKLIDGGGSDYMGTVGTDGWLNLVEELNSV